MMCGLAAVTISAAIATGKLTDPEAWMTARCFLQRLAAYLGSLAVRHGVYPNRIEAMIAIPIE